ncbi:MAG: DUF1501 domain-containing protein, partial [Planctomycetales bacterium]|nr:DUF1501 domain-containing protein [Planctomycetales bacterium]
MLFCWGGMSHIDTWDMKPDAGSDVRGEFHPISTSAADIQICEHMPRLAQRISHLAIVRSMHHLATDHRAAGYWNLTGHAPRLLSAPAIMPSRDDWPSLGAMAAHAFAERLKRSGMPGSVSIPYPIADRGLLNGQFAGMLGADYDPVYVKPTAARQFDGVSPETGQLALDPLPDLGPDRLAARQSLLGKLDNGGALRRVAAAESFGAMEQYQAKALEMLAGRGVREAFDLEREPAAIRAMYGDHICGRSVLLARRLTDAGIPLAVVYCSAGDLNGSAGSHWDTHVQNFQRLRNDMLPPLDQASAALLDDLTATGRLDETLVVWLTEFGRTPKINGGAGRDHYPNCYSAALAGAGVRGGQVYGRSDAIGAEPADDPCGPEHLHATIFRAL